MRIIIINEYKALPEFVPIFYLYFTF